MYPFKSGRKPRPPRPPSNQWSRPRRLPLRPADHCPPPPCPGPPQPSLPRARWHHTTTPGNRHIPQHCPMCRVGVSSGGGGEGAVALKSRHDFFFLLLLSISPFLNAESPSLRRWAFSESLSVSDKPIPNPKPDPKPKLNPNPRRMASRLNLIRCKNLISHVWDVNACTAASCALRCPLGISRRSSFPTS